MRVEGFFHYPDKYQMLAGRLTRKSVLMETGLARSGLVFFMPEQQVDRGNAINFHLYLICAQINSMMENTALSVNIPVAHGRGIIARVNRG
jgi:hypothetical protein